MLRKIFFICLVMLLLLGLQSTCAINSNTTTISNLSDFDNKNVVDYTNNPELNFNKNVKYKIKTDTSNNAIKSYQNLSDTITKSKENKITINLLKNQEYTVTNQIYVNKQASNIIINGNQAVIKGNFDNFRFLRIVKGYNVSLNNLTIKNMGDGTFYAGSIFNEGNLTIHDCNFSSNNGLKGGVFYNTGSLNIQNSNFNNNSGSNAGVIYSNNGILNIISCNFTNNFAYNDDSGVIQLSNFSNGTIINSNFINNSVYNLNVDDELPQGGAIKIHSSNLTVNNSLFKNNSAKQSGGAIFVNQGNITLEYSNFTNNHAHKEDGGALQITQNSFANINECNFMDNYVIYNERKGEDPQAGAVKVYFSNASIKNSIFKNNRAEHSGGVMFLNTCNITIDNCIFLKNYAPIGGSIRIGTEVFSRKTPPTANITIKNTLFENNTSDFQGGAIFTGHYILLNLLNCTFNNNLASDDGGAIEISTNGTGNITNCIFINNSAGINTKNISDLGQQGGAIKLFYSNATLTNNTFKFNKAVQSGGAIHLNTGNMTLIKNMFESNEANFGGAIRLSNELNNKISLNILNNKYINNKAQTNGGALFISDYVDVLIDNSNFTNNIAKSRTGGKGGAIYIRLSRMVLNDSILYNNQANIYGGAIFTENCNSTLNYVNLINNTSLNIGGAIYNNDDSVLMIKDTNIINNTALKNSGSIFTKINDNVNVSNSVFQNNIHENYNFTDQNEAIVNVIAPKKVDTGKNITINITATDKKYNPLTAKAVIKINGLTIKDIITNSTIINIKNGKGTLSMSLSNYSGKEYNVTVVFSKTGYKRIENITKMTVTRLTYKLFTLNYNSTSESTINIKQLLKDSNNNPIYGNTQVAIKLGDKTVLTTKVIDGKLDVNVTVPYLPPGENKFKITLGENYRYIARIINSTINILKQNVTVSITPVKTKAGKEIILNATLKNINTKTNVISGKYIFKINGKTLPLKINNVESYTTKIVKDGIAQWLYNIPENFNKGIYDITISYGGNTHSNPIKYSQKVLTII